MTDVLISPSVAQIAINQEITEVQIDGFIHVVQSTGSQKTFLITTPIALSGNRVITIKNGILDYASPLESTDILGFTIGAANANTIATIQNIGELDGFFGLTAGLPIYLSSNGTITQTVPTTGRLQSLGVALSSTKVLIQIQTPLFLA